MAIRDDTLRRSMRSTSMKWEPMMRCEARCGHLSTSSTKWQLRAQDRTSIRLAYESDRTFEPTPARSKTGRSTEEGMSGRSVRRSAPTLDDDAGAPQNGHRSFRFTRVAQLTRCSLRRHRDRQECAKIGA